MRRRRGPDSPHPKDVKAAQNNNFLGLFIDDIVVGFANRGEMVTPKIRFNPE